MKEAKKKFLDSESLESVVQQEVLPALISQLESDKEGEEEKENETKITPSPQTNYSPVFLKNQIIKAAEKNNFSRLKLLLRFNSPNTIDKNGNTLLHWFASHNNLEAVHFLIAKGANPLVLTPEDPGIYPFEIAFRLGHIKIGIWLIAYLAQQETLIEVDKTDDERILINKLITSLIYEYYRANRENVDKLKNYLSLINPKYDTYAIGDFLKEIEAEETAKHTFFGSYPSETSDTGEEAEFSNLPNEIKFEKVSTAEKQAKTANRAELIYIRSPGCQKEKKAIDGKKKRISVEKANEKAQKQALQKSLKAGDLKIATTDPGTLFGLNKRAKITRPADLIQINKDLEELNTLAKDKKDFSKEDHENLRLQTKFLIAQYRGITYLTTRWSKKQRMRHRKINENGLPVFSQAAYARLKLTPDVLYDISTREEKIEHLTQAASSVAESILKAKESGNVQYGKRTFDNLFYLLQQIYTTDYDGFHKFLKSDNGLKTLFPEGANFFVSTADRPYHSLKYAYGIKPYKGHEGERLRPRWRHDGKAERPYSGKMYISLHPIEDYGAGAPTHVPSLNEAGKIEISTEIIAEHESSFPAMLPSGRVIGSHIAKYPSFRGNYKNIYAYKYGLTPNLYTKFQKAFEKYSPHTFENKRVKKLLGEWLCAYQEVRLIEMAKAEAERQGGILIYRTAKGFSLTIDPAVPSSHSKGAWKEIANQRTKSRTTGNAPSLQEVTKKLEKELSELLIKPEQKLPSGITHLPHGNKGEEASSHISMEFEEEDSLLPDMAAFPPSDFESNNGSVNLQHEDQEAGKTDPIKIACQHLLAYLTKPIAQYNDLDDLTGELLTLSYAVQEYDQLFNANMNDETRSKAIKNFCMPIYKKPDLLPLGDNEDFVAEDKDESEEEGDEADEAGEELDPVEMTCERMLVTLDYQFAKNDPECQAITEQLVDLSYKDEYNQTFKDMDPYERIVAIQKFYELVYQTYQLSSMMLDVPENFTEQERSALGYLVKREDGSLGIMDGTPDGTAELLSSLTFHQKPPNDELLFNVNEVGRFPSSSSTSSGFFSTPRNSESKSPPTFTFPSIGNSSPSSLSSNSSSRLFPSQTPTGTHFNISPRRVIQEQSLLNKVQNLIDEVCPANKAEVSQSRNSMLAKLKPCRKRQTALSSADNKKLNKLQLDLEKIQAIQKQNLWVNEVQNLIDAVYSANNTEVSQERAAVLLQLRPYQNLQTILTASDSRKLHKLQLDLEEVQVSKFFFR